MTHEQTASSIITGRSLSFQPRDVLAIGFRRRGIIVFTFLGILTLTILVGSSGSKTYAASMKILVKRERAEPIVTAEQTPSFQASHFVTEQEINSEIELLWSRDLHEKVVVTARLHEVPNNSFLVSLKRRLNLLSEASREDAKIAAAVLELGRSLQVEPLKKSNFIRVTYSAQDPHLAARVVNTLAELYLAKHLAVHRPAGAFRFFEQETARYRKDLQALQARVADHARAEGVVDVQSEKATTVRQLAEFEGNLERVQVEIAEAQSRIQALEARAAVTPSRVTTEIREAASQVVAQQQSTLLALELKRLELRELFQPSYPPLQEVEKQIGLTRAAISAAEAEPLLEKTTARDHTHEWITTELAKLKSELPALQARLIATARSIQEFRGKARRLDDVLVVQENLVRDTKLAEQNYLIYSRKQEEARISNALDIQRIVNVAIAEAATVPFVPAGRSRKLLLLIGLLLASVCSLALAFVIDFLDPSFRTPAEVEAFLGVPVLAALPRSAR